METALSKTRDETYASVLGDPSLRAISEGGMISRPIDLNFFPVSGYCCSRHFFCNPSKKYLLLWESCQFLRRSMHQFRWCSPGWYLLCWFYLDINVGWSEYFLGDRLVTNISFPEANFNDMEPLGVRKARCDELWSLLCVGDKGVVVAKIKIVRMMPMFWQKIYPSCFQAILHLEGCARNCKMSLSA